MVDGRGNSGGSGGGGGEGAGGASQAWVESNFVSIAYFTRLIKAYGPGASASDPDVEVVPNDVDSTITSIKAMFGLWTEQFISALGQGTGGGGGATALADLVDVQINTSTLAQGQALLYDGNGHWYNGTVQGGGISMTDVWTALAAATNEQINASHLSTALTGYATQTWVGDYYLPLTGGTLTGDLTVEEIEIGRNNEINNQTETLYIQYRGEQSLNICNNGKSTQFGGLVRIATGVGIEDASGNGLLVYHPDNFTGVTSSQWGVGAIDCQGVIRSNNNALIHYKGGTPYEIIDGSGGQSIANSLQVASVKIEQTNEINSQSGMLHLNYRVATNLSLCNGGGNVGIGTSNPSYKLHVDGVIYSTTGVYSAGYVTALSDIRMKKVLGHVELTAEKIAKASAILFAWKDGHDKREHVGGIAQEWQKLLPQAVVDVDGRLSMDYSAIAYVSVVSLAKKVVAQQREIDSLKSENAKLEKRLERLEKMFAITHDEEEDDV
jgi:hypothetical protein